MKKLYLVMVILALFVASCTSGPTGPDPTMPFVGGNKAVQIGFIKGMPPAAVQDNGMQFGVGIMLHNVGEADIGPGTDNPYARVSLEGFRPGAFGLTSADMSKDVTQTLMGSRKNFDGTIIPGQMASVQFEGLVYNDAVEGNLIQDFLVKTCYDYETRATAQLCYKNDIIQTAQDICSLTGEKLPQNSGGPLQISSLVQSPLGPYEVLISMVIEHVGPGTFFGRQDTQQATETCDDSTLNMNRYRVGVEVDSSDAGLEIECPQLGSDNDGTVLLPNGAPTTVTCTLRQTNQDGSAGIYTDPISIKLKYRYGEWMTQQVVIQAVSGIGGSSSG